MSDRFKDMKKVRQEPAAKLLSEANAKLQTKIAAPASALPDVVLAELDEKGAVVDMLRLMSIALPPRERVWWACLAARDFVGPAPENSTPSLDAAEAWVFKPTEENRERAAEAVDHADMEDETTKCALAALYSTGKLGVGDMDQHAAPPGGAETMAFVMNLVSLGEMEGDFEVNIQMMIDRAIDIGRGGNGRLDKADAVEET